MLRNDAMKAQNVVRSFSFLLLRVRFLTHIFLNHISHQCVSSSFFFRNLGSLTFCWSLVSDSTPSFLFLFLSKFSKYFYPSIWKKKLKKTDWINFFQTSTGEVITHTIARWITLNLMPFHTIKRSWSLDQMVPSSTPLILKIGLLIPELGQPILSFGLAKLRISFIRLWLHSSSLKRYIVVILIFVIRLMMNLNGLLESVSLSLPLGTSPLFLGLELWLIFFFVWSVFSTTGINILLYKNLKLR